MFIAVYAFRVKSGMEAEFQEAWAELTREIIAQRNGLGSRLHRDENSSFIAYAQWPERKSWETALPLDISARKKMHDALISVHTLYRLDVVDDLFTHRQKL